MTNRKILFKSIETIVPVPGSIAPVLQSSVHFSLVKPLSYRIPICVQHHSFARTSPQIFEFPANKESKGSQCGG